MIMSPNDKNQDNSIFSKVAASAGFARGAVKTGKAVANVTKGAAAGPYGLVAAGLWEGRHIIGKVLAAFGALLLIPVLYIMMLPSLIFGGGSLDSISSSMLNDSEEIMQNLAEIEAAIEEILNEKQEDVVKQIEKEAKKLGKNCEYSITEAFIDGSTYESSLIISQYCASKYNYADVSLWDLKKCLRKNLKNVFSYVTMVYVYDKVDEATNKTTQITHYDYVIHYFGKEYFATDVFELSEMQKVTAENYAYNLELFIKDMNETK